MGEQVRRLRGTVEATVSELGITAPAVQRVVATALELARQQPLRPVLSDKRTDPGMFELPTLTGSWVRAAAGLTEKLGRGGTSRPSLVDRLGQGASGGGAQCRRSGLRGRGDRGGTPEPGGALQLHEHLGMHEHRGVGVEHRNSLDLAHPLLHQRSVENRLTWHDNFCPSGDRTARRISEGCGEL
ncbi:MAG: hypothetical protein GEV00_23825, partial [Actinophytocola sp.]|nr:hypothetical protein [Actinophytocola sp.]